MDGVARGPDDAASESCLKASMTGFNVQAQMVVSKKNRYL
jgi:hypothetical protein